MHPIVNKMHPDKAKQLNVNVMEAIEEDEGLLQRALAPLSASKSALSNQSTPEAVTSSLNTENTSPTSLAAASTSTGGKTTSDVERAVAALTCMHLQVEETMMFRRSTRNKHGKRR